MNLFVLLVIPLITLVIISFIPYYKETLIKVVSLYGTGLNFLYSILLWLSFDVTAPYMQYKHYVHWLHFYNSTYVVGIDGLSIFFILLTNFLIIICILVCWRSIKLHIKECVILLVVIEFLLLNIFLVLDLLFFYIFFESILIPMFLLIGYWGSRERKIHAAYIFFFYTFFGSVLMLLAILFIYFHVGTTDIEVLKYYSFSPERQSILWFALFFAFGVKIPMFPVHVWLPEAHVEAPTVGSVLLAGILLKMGSYGILRFTFQIVPYGTEDYTPIVFLFALLSIIYASLVTIRQIDLKKIIAYSSVVHMNFIVMGMFSYNIYGLGGSILSMISHGFVSSALFILVGCLYDRYRTRLVWYYGGLAQIMPVFAIIFLFFTLANMSLPGLGSFVGEILILIGIFKVSKVLGILSSVGIIIGSVYSIWLYNRISFGPTEGISIIHVSDITRLELYIFLPLIFLTVLMGIFPSLFMSYLESYLFQLVEIRAL